MHHLFSLTFFFTETALGYACDPLQTGECKDLHSSCVPVDSVYTCLCNVKYYDNSGTCTIREFNIKPIILVDCKI